MMPHHEWRARVASRAARAGRGAAATLLLLGAAGCATVDPTADYDRAGEHIRDATAIEDVYRPDQPPMAEAEVDALLAGGLTAEGAVRIALLRSPVLHEQFARIGIARADWVQSGLLRNPTVGVSILLPEGGGRSLLEAAVAQQIADLWRIPLRREAAEREVDAAVLRTARLAGRLAAGVRGAYHEALAADERMALAEADLGLAREAYEATQRAREIGRATELEERLARLRVFNAQASLAEARQGAGRARRELAYQMSLDRMIDDVELTGPWPTPDDLADEDALVRLAHEQRPDLHAAAHIAEARGVRIALERRRSIPGLSLGAELERPARPPGEGDEGEGIDLLLGPAISAELPVFDQNQARIARAEYERTVARTVYQQLHLRVAHEVRQAALAVRRSAERAARYADDALPEARASVEQAQRAYDAGHIDRLTLLDTQRTHVEARRAYLSAQLDTARELIALESALGGSPR